MLGIMALGGLGLTTSLMAGGANLAMGAAGLGLGAAGLAGSTVLGTVRLAKDSIQSIGLGSGGSQARKRMMERGLIESGVKRTKQLKQMAGKTAGMLGVNLSLASILKQSQIFTGVFGTVFQILGAFIDIILIPLMPLVKWALNGLIDFIPNVQTYAASADNIVKRLWKYLQDIWTDSQGWWGSDGFFANLIKDVFSNHIAPWWKDTAWPAIKEFFRIMFGKEISEADKAIDIMQDVQEQRYPESPVVKGAPEGVFTTKGGGLMAETEEKGLATGYTPIYAGLPTSGRASNPWAEVGTGLSMMVTKGGPWEHLEDLSDIAKEVTTLPGIGKSPLDFGILGGFGTGVELQDLEMRDINLPDVLGGGEIRFPWPQSQFSQDVEEEIAKENVRVGRGLVGSGAVGIAENFLRGWAETIIEGTGLITSRPAQPVTPTAPYVLEQKWEYITPSNKELHRDAYRTDFEVYEDDLYYQEMMMGAGRGTIA